MNRPSRFFFSFLFNQEIPKIRIKISEEEEKEKEDK